jgi:chemotaxis protein MotB
MAKKQKHEDHTNHEAWAIPYGDMVTLLLAFFVVMYSISSVNEGKYRVLSDALSQAFGGPPKSIKPVQFGNHKQSGSDSDQKLNILQQSSTDQAVAGDMHELHSAVVMPGPKLALSQQQASASGATGYAAARSREALQHMAEAVEKAMGPLIDRNMIVVRKSELKLEIEIRTDILFASGAAAVGDKAEVILARLADILKPFPNALRIEGHTDDVPIHTLSFASNWELSAARAASVVHLFMEQGVDPRRMSVEGFGEYRPATGNDTPEGRNRNRRVVLVVLADPGQPMPVSPSGAPSAPATADPAASASAASDATPAAAAASDPSEPSHEH